jgi:uncharacterized protein (DUF488 family)
MPGDDTAGFEVFTIQHADDSIGRFVEFLSDSDIVVVVDIRSGQFSRHVPHFNRDKLEQALEEAGISYVYAGDVLAGRAAKEAADVSVEEAERRDLAGSERFKQGIDRLVPLLETIPGNIAIICAEEEQSRCHRTRLLEPALKDKGVRVVHIRAEAQLDSDKEEAGAGRT